MRKFEDCKPVLFTTLMQVIYATMILLLKATLSQGMNSRIFIVYRHAIAAISLAPAAYVSYHRTNRRPVRANARTICLLILCAFIGVTLSQNFYQLGLNLGSSALATAMGNSTPAITFVIAASFGMEKLRIRKFRSMAKVLGTAVCVGGALLMTLYRGDRLLLFKLLCMPSKILESVDADWIKACAFVFASCCCGAIWLTMQVPLMDAFGDPVLLAFLMCLCGSILSAIVALFLEDLSAWVFQTPLQIFICVYGGTMGSGVINYLQAWCISKKGPLFTAVFSPLSTVITTILAFFFLGEELYAGSVIGAAAVVGGLYLVLWGKRGDLELKKNCLTSVTLASDKNRRDVEQPLLAESRDGTI